MKNKKTITVLCASVLMLAACFFTGSFAHAQMHSAATKDCCMMKDGKMMQMKGGKITPMDKEMTMENGTKCMTNGECITKDGKKMQMIEGDCIDMSGKMDKCTVMNKDTQKTNEKKNKKKEKAITYTCPMHPEVTSDKPGKCPKCGMDLVKKK
jgi:hypothetical protein